MKDMYFYFVIYILPPCEVLLALIIGRHYLRRSKLTRSYVHWSVGVSLITTAILSVIGLIWLVNEYNHTYSWGKFIILIAPFLPVYIIGIGSILMFSGLTVWGHYKNRFVHHLGLSENAGKFRVWLSGGLLTGTMAAVLIYLLPYIHLLPYRSLSYESGRFGGDTQILKVEAGKYFSNNYDQIMTIKNRPWSSYDAELKLQLDWRGRVELKVRHIKPPKYAGDIKTYYLPFEKSSYAINNGMLTREE